MSTTNPLVASDEDRWFAPDPGWWTHALSLVDRGALALLDRDAASGITTLGRIGRWAHTSGLVPPTADDVAALFPDRDRADATQIARASAALRFKNRGAIALRHQRGIEALASLVSSSVGTAPAALTAQAHGAILLAFHVGAQFGVGATLHHWGVPTLTVRNMAVNDGHERARALRHTVDALRGGAIVIAAVDGPGGASTAPFTCLGRRIVLRRGPFMLARVTRVALIPVAARWTPGGQIELEVGPPLDVDRIGTADAVETRFAAAAGRWLERYLRAHPDDLWPYTLANFLAAPRG